MTIQIRSTARAAAALALLATACTSTPADDSSASFNSAQSGVTVVVNANVYTVDEAFSTAESFAYNQDGLIIAVGTEADVRTVAGDDATVLDAAGGMVIPGFQDAHVHVPEAGLNADVCFFPDGLSLDDYEALASECADEQEGAEWVRAAGASLFDLRDTAESPLAVLDRAIPDRPALVLDNLGHAVWTNSLGLEAAGISDDDPDPQGGVFHRDQSGELTGLLLEDAQQLVRNAAATDDTTNDAALIVALEELASNGVTTVSDAGGYWAQNHPGAWQRAEAADTLTVRAFNTLYLYPDLDIDEQLAEFERRFSNESDMLRFDTAKVYIDGILDLGTASLIEPYDQPVDANYPTGFNYFTEEQLNVYVNGLHDLGYRISFHVIGDQAVRDALDAIAGIDDNPDAIADRRHRTTHTYMVNPSDVGRFAELGVVVDFQQSDDAITTDYHEYLADFIGERAFDLIPTAELLDAGATVTLSSDWDAGPLPPLGTIERSLTRQANAVPDLETALVMHTIAAAYALGHDDSTGSIEVGKFADYVILERDFFELDHEDIDQTQILMTVVDGSVVYQDAAFKP